MLVRDCNWLQIEDYLKQDDRAALPIGCTEQHAFLSLATDSILAERVAQEAAEPLGVPVFPAITYGITPYFMAFPGTVSLRVETMLALVRDILDGLDHQGFRRILLVNGHGGNAVLRDFVAEWGADHPRCSVKFHNWWNAPLTAGKVLALDPLATHASWMENFPWTRLGNDPSPDSVKPAVPQIGGRNPEAVRHQIGDGNFGGRYRRPDDEMLAVWQVAVEETRALLTTGWP
ncbi:creatininase family protein [Acidiphilium sp. PA]|uniref:creatininase family protein n=1 Tax=Acidiphilium sp. PA TaxID=2871705 RepID=UPI002244EDC3|nr:creatininase family protein [Acidiphilium sp. PA]MCW8308585.1 creatininase family protein [Acidiphilium sp. PA]